MSKSFLYFGYGSNLLAQRIRMNSPSACRKGSGKIKNYRLDFNTFSNRWKGASATIVPHKGKEVWGAIWEISLDELANLDKQEGVDQNIYFAFETAIETPEGTQQTCRIYQQVNIPETLESIEELPENRKPSAVYLNTIIRGACETKLPEHYQKFLKSIPHNGYNGEVDLKLLLDE